MEDMEDSRNLLSKAAVMQRTENPTASETSTENPTACGISDDDHSTEDLFAKVYTQFKMHFYREVFRNFENREATLTTVETFCMEVIYAMGRPTINEFATFLRMSSPNAAYKVNNLVRKGYLRKVRSETDRREYYLEVTQRYLDYCNISNSYVDDVMSRVRKRMSESEWDSFRHTLRILSDEMHADIPVEVIVSAALGGGTSRKK